MNTESAPSEDEGHEPRKTKTHGDLAAIKQQSMRAQIGAAYEAFLRGEHRSDERLMGVVKDFVFRKVVRLEFEFKDERGTSETADDWTQDVAMDIWIALPRLRETVPTGDQFYFYLNKTAFHRRKKAGGYLVRQKNLNVPVLVEHEDEDGGDAYLDDNPEIYNRTTINSGFVLPRMDALDEAICLLIADGKTYTQVAQELKTTESNVKKRLQRLRGKVGAERAAEREKNLARQRAAATFKIDHPSRRKTVQTVAVAVADADTAVTA